MTAFQHGHDAEQPSSGPRDDDLASAAAARQSLVFEHSHDAILIAGSDGRYFDANPAALTLLGYEREELLGRHFTDVVPPGPTWTAETYDRFVSGGAWEGEVDVRTKAGGLTPTSARTVVLSRDHAGVHVTMLRDLSDRNASEVTRSGLRQWQHLHGARPVRVWGGAGLHGSRRNLPEWYLP